MKTLRHLLVLTLAFSAFSLLAQVSPMFEKSPGTVNRDAGYDCPPASLYSQLPDPITGAWHADEVRGITIADDYTVAGTITTMRFWGVNLPVCAPGATQTFTIKFFERNTLNPAIPGDEFTSFILSAVPQQMTLGWSNAYQADVTFPVPVTLNDGWVSVTRNYPGDGCFFGWIGAYGGNLCGYSNEYGWVTTTGSTAFCLGGTPEEVPVENWALMVGILLIGTFVLVRYRRLI